VAHRGEKTKGRLEAEISEAVTRFEKEYIGRGPAETKTYLIDDLVVVRLRGVLTPAEHQLATGGGDSRGRELVKQVRLALIEKARPLLETVVEQATGRRVTSLYTDMSTVSGQQVIVFELVAPPDVRPTERPPATGH
jgi:uncharacterized protein YbcI